MSNIRPTAALQNTRDRALHNFISLKNLKLLAPNFPTYWPSHANRHTDTIVFFITNFPNSFLTEIVNLNDPTSDHTPVLLHVGAQPILKPKRPI